MNFCEQDRLRRNQSREEHPSSTLPKRKQNCIRSFKKPMFQSLAGKNACKFLIEDEILRELGHKRDTISNAVKKLGARPYKKQKTPQLDSRIREQRAAYAKLGPVAQLIENG